MRHFGVQQKCKSHAGKLDSNCAVPEGKHRTGHTCGMESRQRTFFGFGACQSCNRYPWRGPLNEKPNNEVPCVWLPLFLPIMQMCPLTR